MKIILIKDKTKQNAVVSLSQRFIVCVGLLFMVVLPIALASSIVFLSNKQSSQALTPSSQDMRFQVSEQMKDLSETREYVKLHIDALGRSIGSLQAQVSRINAVEKLIAQKAGIDLSNFDFEVEPPVGGAETSGSASEQVDIVNAIVDIQKELALRESQIETFDFILSNQSLENKLTPSGWPVQGGWISSNFGMRMHPITGRKQFHRGVDIPGKKGGAVTAVADGIVVRSEKTGPYGWVIEVDHGDKYRTLYGHNRANLVEQGEVVKKGQAIAELGSTGNSTGPHVHFEVLREGKNINPVKYLYREG